MILSLAVQSSYHSTFAALPASGAAAIGINPGIISRGIPGRYNNSGGYRGIGGDIGRGGGGSTEPHVLSYPGRRDNQLFISRRGRQKKGWMDAMVQ
jgi:hypothetical protein